MENRGPNLRHKITRRGGNALWGVGLLAGPISASTTPHSRGPAPPLVWGVIAPLHFSSLAKTARTATASAEARYDAALVFRVNAGDETAFVEIITRYRDRTFSIAFSVLRNRADADEITQDTFIRAHRGLVRFRGDSSLATWMHRITLNLARNRYWYLFRRRQHLTRSLDSAFSDDNQATLASLVASDAPSPVRQAATSEFFELVTACMEQLDSAHREILRQRNILNWSYGEIARTLGISIGTVKSRIARARVKLRELLGQACPEFSSQSSPNEWFDPIRSSGCVEAICA